MIWMLSEIRRSLGGDHEIVTAKIELEAVAVGLQNCLPASLDNGKLDPIDVGVLLESLHQSEKQPLGPEETLGIMDGGGNDGSFHSYVG
jgi:hypothetical protein